MGQINVIPVKSPIVNHYIVTDGHDTVIIDTGMPGDYKKTITAIKRISPTIRTSAILITHADADHYGSVTDIRNYTGANTYASVQEAAAIQLGRSSREINPHGAQRFFYMLGKLIFRAKPGIITN
ncbi:MAG: MBL fold metallo-hydrolase, partial [Anaerolineaceae bacterium]|nr:MBL fold metallo-hydrolase [Anaerolineaceae bacterium]